MMRLMGWKIAILLVVWIGVCWGQFKISMRSNPSGCIGGQPCIFQPSVAIYTFDNQIAINYQGTVSVVMGASPSGFELLYARECNYDGCGEPVTGTMVSVPIIVGLATFSNITLATQGAGYTLQFIGRDISGAAFASTFSQPFNVITGPVYKLQFSTFFGHTLGGQPFSPQPVIATVDRGGNHVSSVNNFRVTVSLSGQYTEILPTTSLTAEFFDGLAQFSGLYINQAASGYRMEFTSNIDFVYMPVLRSGIFTIGIGEPYQMQFVPGTRLTDNAVILGGEFIPITPQLRIVDKGGNLVSTDSTSGVKILISNNPSKGQLLPLANTFQTAVLGIVRCPSLRITTVGKGYVLSFTLYRYIQGSNSYLPYTSPSIVLLSELFTVSVGLPRSLFISVPATRAYGGGQSFAVQPVVQIRDYGNNAVSYDYESKVTASMISSLASSSKIRLQADTNVTNSIVSVSTDTPSGTYGVGEAIYFKVLFQYEVWVKLLVPSALPYLTLTSVTAKGVAAVALLDDTLNRKQHLLFKYVVAEGDSIIGLDYVWIHMNGSSIKDGNGHGFLLTMPGNSAVGTKSINIDTSVTTPIFVNTSTPSGEYGAGEVIPFFIRFSSPIAVIGEPLLLLNITRKMYGYVFNGVRHAYATYSRLHDSHTAVFDYLVASGDNVQELQFLPTIQTPNSSSIRRASTSPIQAVNYTIGELLPSFLATSSIIIDTSIPILNTTYGVQTSHADGTFYPGEVFFIRVQFNKPIVIQGVDIVLIMECGVRGEVSVPCDAPIDQVLPDQKTLQFRFQMPNLVNTSQLDIVGGGNALRVPKLPYYIRRLSTNPTTDADVNTTNVLLDGHSLAYNSRIHLYGFVPLIRYTSLVSYNSSSGTSVLRPGDTVYFSVTFSTKIITTCSPVVAIAVGFVREAVYVSGNLTKSFIFKYTVNVGDFSTGLNYRFNPNALCYMTGCPTTTTCTMKAYSTNPVFRADISMPLTNGNRATGIPIAYNITVFGRPAGRNTTILSIVTTTPNGNYGAGTIIQFLATFTDDVLYTTTTGLSAPKLYLTNGKYANYSGGSGTPELLFYYIIQPGDSTLDFDLKVNPLTGNVFTCPISESCFLKNRIGQYVDQTSTSAVVTYSSIVIDTRAPQVIEIWTTKPTSPYYGRYTVGEAIEIYVSFNKPVSIVGSPPRIIMNTTNHLSGLQYAYYARSKSNSTFLVFDYSVAAGDYSPNLVYLVNAIDLNNGQTVIYRQGDLPITLANLTLPVIETLSRTGDILHIETNNPPHVLHVNAVPTSGLFRVGDWFLITVTFSQYVVCTGSPVLSLNGGDHVSFAEFINPILPTENSTGYPTLPSTVLTFKYTVVADDFSYDLDYTDRYSLSAGKIITGAPGTIYAAATTLSQEAVLDLPVPSSPGSLSATSNIYMDGRVTYETSLTFENPSGTYGVGEEIFIRMNFSSPVFVYGLPMIMMETGEYFDRPAKYFSGNGTDSLLFLFVPQPGDFNPIFDYVVDRAALSSAKASFVLNGKILTASVTPSLPVFVHLNPIKGFIFGETTLTASVGLIPFLDLGISIRGPDYVLRFTGAPILAHATLSTYQNLFVSFSNQFDLIPVEAQKGDLIGSGVAANGNIVAVGAPHSNLSVTTIQTVTTTGAPFLPTPEVQVIRTVIQPRPGIQSFHTTADVNEVVGGQFRMSYGHVGPTRWISANLNGEMITVFLSQDFASLGNISVSRSPYIFCACENAFTWTVTFLDIDAGDMLPLTFDFSRLTGAGAAVSGLTVVQAPAKLAGTFTLSSFGLESRPIPVTATVRQITNALNDLGLAVLDIHISPSDQTLQRSWIVTFDAYNDFYEIPVLQANYEGLTGGDCRVVVQITRPGIHGPAGLEGSFKLSWRGNTTISLHPNTSAAEMKAALEALPVINTVNVNRSLASPINGFTWTIEFVEVQTNSPRGYTVDTTANCEPIVPINNLIGTDTDILVGSSYALGKPHSFSDIFRQGTYGTSAGAVYMFQKTIDEYVQVATVRGDDTNENDQFGFSVAMDTDVMIVGAMSADKNGVLEKQAVFCSAKSGFFILKFRGWTSDPISASATISDLYEAIVANSNSFAKMYNLINIYIADWGGGRLCENNTAVITFYSPVDGAPNLFPVDTGSNLELMTVSTNMLDNNGTGVVQVLPIQDGTIRVHGLHADPQQIGSAYIFVADYHCASNVSVCYKRNWVQIAQFFPTENLDKPTKFGYSVSINATVAVVGAPGDGPGSAYVFTNVTGKWLMLQRVQVASLQTGDAFGYSVSVYQNTIFIGAPFYNDNQGIVFVYKRPPSGGVYSLAQTLYPPQTLFLIGAGDLYGISVSCNENTAVIGSAGRNAPAVYTGVEVSSDQPISTGQVFVFQRAGELFDYKYSSVLEPTNVKSYDQFGWSVALHQDFVVASSLQEYSGVGYANKVIMEINTTAAYIEDRKLTGYFNLDWIYTNASSGVWRTARTRNIPFDCNAGTMKEILETDLSTGNLIVSRSNADVYNNGYSWQVTFLDHNSQLPPFIGVADLLEGLYASVIVTILNPYPTVLRGVTHVFQRTALSPNFVEQAFLEPVFQQPADRCGWRVALNGNTAVVGCPNRDSIVPNRNSGAAITYSLSLLHITFDKSSVSTVEGQLASVNVIKTSSSVSAIDVLFYITTIDRNADYLTQGFLLNLFGLTNTSILYPLTACDVVGVSGLATGRAQYYGSSHNESLWVDGMYDYRAISDYVPINAPRVFLVGQSELNQSIITNPDTILEKPDEIFIVSLNSPGIWPSMKGTLQIPITIIDDLDGVASGFTYDKLYDDAGEPGAGLGGSLVINNQLKVMFCSSPLGSYEVVSPSGAIVTTPGSGYVVQYHLANSGQWFQMRKIFSPQVCANCLFGDEVKLSVVGSQNTSILAIGEPVTNSVYIYVSAMPTFGQSWHLETKLSVEQAYLPNHRFGAADSIGLSNNIIAIGAIGIESVFLFKRLYSNHSNSWYWTDGLLLRSSDYDYDLINGVPSLHRQFFGKAVAISQRTIVVGSPFADYGNIASPLVEINWRTEGTDIFGYGRGKVYVYSSQGAVQTIYLYADATLSFGSFRLQYSGCGQVVETVLIPYSADNITVANALNSLYFLDGIVVSTTFSLIPGTPRQNKTWSITFVDEWDNPPLLVPLWSGHGCTGCVAFSSPFSPDNDHQMKSIYTSYETPIEQVTSLSASDKSSGSRFGWSVALDGNQLMVGSIHSPSFTSTTWDFEGGSLVGWSKTGTAFDFQPTFGDNSYLRSVYPAVKDMGFLPRSEKSGLIGKYYIGTFEMRPGNTTDWRVPSSKYPQGSSQGDGPVGTLTSDVFIVLGNSITFLIGGGCDYYKTYVELVVDGFSAAKQTGECRETMGWKSFDTSLYLHRAAQIRIVDNSQSKWGHINCDEFRFSWDVNGARLSLSNARTITGGKIETPKSGAVYGFLRHIKDSFDLCFSNTRDCEWTEEIKLTPSDKRAHMFFGSSVAVNDHLGLTIVGAPGAECTGIYKEIMSVYPYMNEYGTQIPAGLKFPLNSQKYLAAFESSPLFAPQPSGASGVWLAREDYDMNPNILSALSCGAAYIYVKIPYVLAPLGGVLYPQRWPNTETARLQASDLFAGDNFGGRIAISDMMIAVGAVGQDGGGLNSGAIYAFNLGFSSLYFDTDEFFVLQGTDNYATITVRRNTKIFAGLMEIEYATSDLTAKGVDSYKYQACLAVSPAERGPSACGDYEQTTGRIKFNPGDNSGGFYVNIFNYRCTQPYLKYFQVTLSVPGSNGVQGQTLTAKVRIDDNNFLYDNCLTLYPSLD